MFFIICSMDLYNVFHNEKMSLPIHISGTLVAKQFHQQIDKMKFKIALIEFKL
jgi:hypothetical protein